MQLVIPAVYQFRVVYYRFAFRCKARRQAKVEGGTFPVAESSKVPSMSKKMARKDMVPPKEKAFARKAFSKFMLSLCIFLR